MKTSHKLLKILNSFIIKKRRTIYAIPHPNCKVDFYDLINYSSDNVLCLVNQMMADNYKNKTTIYLEYYRENREKELLKYIKENNNNENLEIILLKSDTIFNGIEHIYMNLRNRFKRYQCKIWLTDTSSLMLDEKCKRQVLIDMNYSTPFKMAPKPFDFSYIDYSFETSLLCATVHSALYRIRLENSICVGFPRNDHLFESKKAWKVRQWIKRKTDIEYNYLLVYAPTYREYNGAFSNSILGFQIEQDELDDFLKKYGILLITKFHPLQDVKVEHNSKYLVPYEKTFDFGLYDLLSISSALISDYSSVMHDYVITGKPIILNCFDETEFDETRGFSFDPISTVFPGPVIRNKNDFFKTIEEYIINKTKIFDNEKVKRLFHKYPDNKSSERANLLMGEILDESVTAQTCLPKNT